MSGTAELLDLFPPGTVEDTDGMLMVGGCRLDDLAREYGTPVMVVAEGALRQRARAYRERLAARWADSRVVFASKAFACTAVQRLMVSEGLWIDVAGGGEIVTALAAGADPSTLVLHGNAKTTDEIQLAVRSRVGTVVVDNFDDIDRLESVVVPGQVQACLVRVIPGVQASTHAAHATGHEGSKFGLSPPDARRAIARIEASDRLRMDGLHTHVGSQILVADELAAAVAPLGAIGQYPVYDLGGGLGARYTYTDHPPSLDTYLDALIGAAREHLPTDARILIEPGRSVVAANAVTIYTVTTVKSRTTSAAAPTSPTFVAVDGGMGDNLEVSLVGQRFEATIANRVGGGQQVTVVGRHCESGDVLADPVLLRDPQVGDLLVIPVTGAYCFTMSNNYNGARRVPVVFADAGTARLVVRRDTWADLLVRDVQPLTG
jgi:diaminopimelate decarboxylase